LGLTTFLVLDGAVGGVVDWLWLGVYTRIGDDVLGGVLVGWWGVGNGGF
jgi:hypothetical protein